MNKERTVKKGTHKPKTPGNKINSIPDNTPDNMSNNTPDYTPVSQLTGDLLSLLDIPSLSDLTIVAENGQEFKVHKLIIMCRCPSLLEVSFI